METSGFCPQADLEAAAAYTDLFLFDVKETDAARHKAYTGVDFHRIHENAGFLSRLGKELVLRCPLIPGYNLRRDHALGIAALAGKWQGVKAIQLQPYHPLGVDKYANLGLEPVCADRAFLDHEAAEEFRRCLAAETDIPVSIS